MDHTLDTAENWTTNEYGQPIGRGLPSWTPRPLPPRTPVEGRFCRIEPISTERHGEALLAAYAAAPDSRDWTYMSVGPFPNAEAYRGHLAKIAASGDPLHYAIVDKSSGMALGTFALMRIDRNNGVIEVGFVAYSRKLRRTRIATEAMYLLIKRVFDELGYRRLEWKCDHLNAPSRAAALRYGFRFEGIFRQAVVYKGRTRDTAWYSIIDAEWPVLEGAYEAWLDVANFDAAGNQIEALGALIEAQREKKAPR